MGNLFYKFIKLAISVFAIFLVSKVFLIKGVKADYMRPIEVCIRHVGYPNNNGVVELRDQKGARRFVRIGQGQYSTTPHVRDYYDCDGRRRKNCAFFQGWGLCMGVRECRDQRDGSSWLDYNGMDWLCSHGETFPAYLPPNWTKYKNYASSCDLAHWGCGEDPLYIDVHIRDCECGSAVWGYGENHDNHGCNYPSRFTITCNCAPPLGQCGQSCAVTGICDVGYSCRNGVCCNRCSPTSYSCSGGCQCPCGTWCDYNSDCTTGLTCLEGRCCRYCSDTDDYQCSGGCQCLAPPTIESITPQAVCIDPTTGNPVDWSGRGMTVPFTVVYRSSSGAGGWGFDTIGFGVDLTNFFCDLSGTTISNCRRVIGEANVNAVARRASVDGSRLTVIWDVEFLSKEGRDIPILAYARHTSEGRAEWEQKTTWNVDLTPPHAEVITSSSSITWVANDEVGDVRSGFRNAEMSITDTVNDVVVFSDTVIGGAGVNQITDFASLGLSAGEYMAYMQVWDNACNLEAIREFFTVGEGGNSWLMTEYGDSFAKDGYSDIQMGATSNTSNGNLNTLYPPEGATNPFSRYIISSKNTTLTSDPSRRDYELVSSSGYDDQNMKKFSPTFSVYNFLMDIVDAPINEISANDWSQLQHGVNIYKAGGEYDGSLTIPAGATCNHQAVVFVEGNLTLDASFKINDSDPVINGCLFVVKGNTIVSSGGAGGINFMDGFFVTDGTFTTECGGTLVIKGGVLTGTASFGCPGDGSNPGEIIDYDARYLDILRAYLGADYPYRIREWKYSTAD